MIYTIKNDVTGALIYDPRVPEAVVTDPRLQQSDNACGSLKFSMYPSHAEYSNIHKRRTIFAVYRDDATNPIFKGICKEGTDDLNKVVDFYFEDFMSVLRDSMQDPFEFHGDPLDFLTSIIAAHNAQVETWQRITLGHVTVTDPNGYIYRKSESELSTWEVIQTRFIDPLGGHLRMRYSGGVAYLDYLEGSTSSLDPYLNTSTQTIEIGENLKEFSRLISAGETYSACIPKGAEMEMYDDDGNAYSARLTIANVNGGSKYLVNEDAVALYGFRCAPLDETTWDDVTLPANLKTKGLAYLTGTLVKLSNSISLSALDLHHLGVASDSFGFLDYVRVSLYNLGIDEIYLLTTIDIPLDDPSELEISLGETFLSLAGRQAEAQLDVSRRLETAESTLANEQIRSETELAERTTELRSLIEQTGNAILTQVSEIYTSSTTFEQFQSQVSTMLTQTSNAFTLQFQTLTTAISTLEGSTNTQFSRIDRYIQFIDGNIVLGERENPLILKITNERISFLSNNVEIAYFSSGRLYVDNLEAITSLTLGLYAFVPDASGGMALKYVGH